MVSASLKQYTSSSVNARRSTMQAEPPKKSLRFKLGAATFRGIAYFFNGLYDVMMDHDQSQGEKNNISDQQSSTSPLSSNYGLVPPQERYSMNSKLPLSQAFEDPQDPDSREYLRGKRSPMDQNVKDPQEPYSMDITPPMEENLDDLQEPYSTHITHQPENVKDRTEMVGSPDVASVTSINVVIA